MKRDNNIYYFIFHSVYKIFLTVWTRFKLLAKLVAFPSNSDEFLIQNAGYRKHSQFIHGSIPANFLLHQRTFSVPSNDSEPYQFHHIFIAVSYQILHRHQKLLLKNYSIFYPSHILTSCIQDPNQIHLISIPIRYQILPISFPDTCQFHTRFPGFLNIVS